MEIMFGKERCHWFNRGYSQTLEFGPPGDRRTVTLFASTPNAIIQQQAAIREQIRQAQSHQQVANRGKLSPDARLAHSEAAHQLREELKNKYGIRL